jgi:hypothetical protein
MSNILPMKRRNRQAKPVATYGPVLRKLQFNTYQPGQHCPNCDNKGWEIRTLTATCTACGEVLERKWTAR